MSQQAFDYRDVAGPAARSSFRMGSRLLTHFGHSVLGGGRARGPYSELTSSRRRSNSAGRGGAALMTKWQTARQIRAQLRPRAA
jgi:hypothetical protein